METIRKFHSPKGRDWVMKSGEDWEKRYSGKRKGSTGWYGESIRHSKAAVKGWKKKRFVKSYKSYPNGLLRG